MDLSMDNKHHNPYHCDIPDLLPGIIYRCQNDEAWTMLYLSDKSIDLLGYTLAEVNEISYNKIIDEEFRESVHETINNALDKKETFKITYSVTSKNGDIIWLEEHGKGVFEAENLLYLEGYIHDITEQIEYKKEHKKELKRLERAENIGQTGNWEIDLNTKIVYVSTGAREIYELENEALTLELIQQVPLAKYRKPLDKALKELINGTKPYHIQFEIKGAKTGVIKTVESVAQYSKSKNAVFGVIKDITLQNRQKNELIQAKNKFELMTVNSADCIWQMDKKLRFTYLSPALYNIFGYKPDEWLGTPLFAQTTWLNFAKMARLALRTLQDYKKYKHVTFESFLYNKQKELIPVEIIGKPLLNSKGKLIGLQGSIRDIRNHSEYKNEIRALNERLTIANQAVNNGIWDWNSKTDALYWDDLMYDIYGIKKGDASLNYQNWKNAVLAEDLEFAEQKINEAIENKGIFNIQFRINHPQKGIRYIKAFAKYVELDEPHFIGVNYDNTERVNSRLKLSQSEELFRELFEQNNDIIAILSPEGKLLNMNEKGMKVYGLTKENLNQYSFSDFTVDINDKNHSVDIIKSLNEHKLISPYHKQFKVRNNRITDFEVSVSPIYNEAGALQRIVTILRDVSERIAYENEILKQSEKAKESDRLKTAFLMNMSHEIRTPLNAIMGFSDILKDTELDSTQKEFINHIQNGSTRIVNTITDLIEASQLQQKQFNLSLEDVDVLSLVSEVFYSSKEFFQHRLSDIDYSFNTNISEDITISADAERMQAILARIIDNAFKFTKKGVISLECLLIEQNIEINIKDSGTGIEKEKLQLIFDFFRQGDDSLTRGYEGLGLGLPIAKGNLELMGGEIDIISEPDVGTNISIKLPVKTKQQEGL
jgi:PAS domain S-box-containing protein